MPRGLDPAITAELASTTFGLPIYALRITRRAASILRWGEHDFTIGGEHFETRLQSLTGITFSPDQASPITMTVANIDGAVTTADRNVSFRGAKVEVLGYMELSPPVLYSIWTGFADEIQEMSAESATLIAYPTIYIPNVQVPRRTIGLACTNRFGNIANWNSALDFEGSECPYQRVSTIGFVAANVGALGGLITDTTVIVLWTSPRVTAGGKFEVGDRIKIGAESMRITATSGDPDGSFNQTLTVERGDRDTVIAAHADNATVLFDNCGFSVSDCKTRGMYGNNPDDSYTV